MNRPSKFFNYVPKSDGGATILLYGDVGPWGDIDSQRVVTELLALEGEYNSIDVRINSTGGDVFTGIAIFNALRQSKANIKIYVDGIAASIAGVIALCGKPLYMSQYARLMLHKVSGGAYGSAKELRETADLIENLEGSLAEMVAQRANLTKEEVHSRYFADGKDHWLTAKEALALGMIDGIHDLPEETDLDESSSTDDIYQVFNNRLEKTEAQEPSTMALLDEIKRIPSFANATEADIVTRLQNQALKLEEKDKAITNLQERVAELEAKELEALLNTAVADGRITQEQKPTYLNLLKSDRANAEALLASLPKADSGAKQFHSAKQFTQPTGSGANKFHGKTWRELDKENLLAEYKKCDPEGFASLYKDEFGVDYQN